MVFLTPSLDDRRFQDIVDQAKSLIPRYCPEWTDHNVSDPGVALIELFAWMTELLLYRVNQVPDRMYVRFLEMIGVRLEPPRAARAPVTFYLSAPQASEQTIDEGTEVATVRTETSPATVFTTESPLVIRPPNVLRALTRNVSRGEDGDWTQHDLRRLALPGHRLRMFPPHPAPGDAFYLAFKEDHSAHVLALVVNCELAGGAGVDPTQPPLEWQAWQGASNRWAACEVEHDGTGGFNRSGEVILHVPAMAPGTFHELHAYWLRCRLTDAQAARGYEVSPDLQSLRVESRGGTAVARHAVTIQDEVLGRSDGTPGQTFRLLHTPVLARDRERDTLVVEGAGEEVQRWREVADFADSGPEDRVFTLDELDGTLTLGPSLLQPDGAVYHFGAVPPRGSTLKFSRYQCGGGVEGNVPAGALSILKSAIPYVARVVNRREAVGGRNAQTLEDAKLRAPQYLRSRTRAVTADDYEYLACQVPGVARARCLAAGAQPGGPTELKPGQVCVVVLPQADAGGGPIAPAALTLSAELRNAVFAYLDERRVAGTALEVRGPHYVWVRVEARLRLAETGDATAAAEARAAAEQMLYRYLNPLTGGPDGRGWPFGRDLHVSEIYALLQRVPGVEFLEDVRLSLVERGSTPETVTARLQVPRHGLVCSDQHRVTTG